MYIFIRDNLILYPNTSPHNLDLKKMKIRFLTKKQREELKNKKEMQENNKSLQVSHRAEQNDLLIPKKNDIIEEKYGGDLQLQEQSDMEEDNYRERSREKHRKLEAPELNDLEKKQIKQMKNKYMGIVKTKTSRRFENDYKEKLLFEWDKSEDTSGGALNASSMEALRKFESKFKNKTDDCIGKKWNEKTIEEMTDRDWRIFRQDNEIFIKGGRVPNPFRDWSEYEQLHPQLVSRLKNLQFMKPKPIQMQAIPIGIAQKDMMALAPTGEGKTLAFLIPIITKIANLPRITALNSGQGPYAIILVPSRQLAQQIFLEFNRITFNQIKALTIIGGIQLDLQILEIQKGCDILIGTPGRLKQLIEKNCLRLARTFFGVIDQADKMISENLIDDIEAILDEMSMGNRDNHFQQTYEEHKKTLSMFSATMLPQIEKLTRKYLVTPVSVTIGEVGAGKKQIEQYVQIVAESQKNDELGKILKGLPGPIIVFVNSRVKCEKLAKIIEMRFNRSACEYHGGKTQETRQLIIQNFRQGKFEVLVATDLGGRGLDIKGISAAISYDAPKNISEFIHRAGRSGRAGVKGKAYTLLTNENQGIFYDIKLFLQKNDFPVPQSLRDHPAAQFKPGTIQSVSRSKQVVYANE